MWYNTWHPGEILSSVGAAGATLTIILTLFVTAVLSSYAADQRTWHRRCYVSTEVSRMWGRRAIWTLCTGSIIVMMLAFHTGPRFFTSKTGRDVYDQCQSNGGTRKYCIEIAYEADQAREDK